MARWVGLLLGLQLLLQACFDLAAHDKNNYQLFAPVVSIAAPQSSVRLDT